MIQSIINKLYRHPKAELKRLNRFGGYFAYKKMVSGQKEMECASAGLPPVHSSSAGLPVYFLTGEKFLYQTLFCIQSLSRHTREKFQFILVDDGTFDEELIQRINKQLPGAAIVTKTLIQQNIDKVLPKNKYPALRRKRSEYPHIKKLTDVHTIPGQDWKLILDSDMLFFSNPAAIITWLKYPLKPVHMVDCAQSYGYSNSLMEKLAGNTIPVKLNVGAIGLNSRSIDWEKLENWVRVIEEKEGRSYYLEQALSAMLVAGEDCEVLNKDDYIVNPDDKIISDSTGILHHYVDLSKKGYFNSAWRKVI